MDNDIYKIFETMDKLGLDTKKLRKYTVISEYCALLKLTADTTHKYLIEKGCAVFAKRDDLTSCIKFIQEKLAECYEKGAEIIDLLKNN